MRVPLSRAGGVSPSGQRTEHHLEPHKHEVGPLPSARRQVSGRAVLLALATAHLVAKLAVLPIAIRTPLQGDEITYHAAARTIASALRSVVGGDGLPVSQLQEGVIGFGWFMPGMPLVLAPVYLVTPSPGIAAIRLYLGLLTTVVLLLGAALLARSAGTRYGAAVLLFPGLVPIWLLFSYTSWGDLSAGLVLVVLVAVLVRLWRRLDAGSGLRLRDGGLVGLLLVITLYLRSSVLPLVVLVMLLGLVAVLRRSRGAARVRSLAGWVAAVATFVALLAPWSYAATRTLHDRVITTTTVPISMAYAFGNRDELCFGPCPDGNPWYSMVRFSRKEAARTGESELAVQRRMSDYAMRDVTAGSYASDVLANFGRYALQPAGFESLFRVPGDATGQTPAPPDAVSTVISWTTVLIYFPVLMLAVGGILRVRRAAAVPQLVGLLAATLGGG